MLFGKQLSTSAAVVGAMLASCAVPDRLDDKSNVGSSGGAGATAGEPGTGASTASGGSGGGAATGGSSSGGRISLDSGAGDAGEAVDACVTAESEAMPVPSILQLVVDTSGSMKWGPDGATAPPDGASKWAITRNALIAAAARLPEGDALGLNFYPNTDLDVPCIVNQQALPIAPLGVANSPQRQNLGGVLAAVTPLGGTPTHAAYRFGLQQLESATQPGDKFLILITDGVPTFTLECSGDGHAEVDSAPLVADAAAAFNAGIRTFVIGSPGSEAARSALSSLATAGGTAMPGCLDSGPQYCHFDLTSVADLGESLTQALDAIRRQVLSCQYAVPAPPGNKTLDPSRVNVRYTSSDGASETIPRDPSAAECNAGWQYTTAGDHVVLCPDACERIRDDVGGEVEIVFGCKTEIAVY